MARLSILKWDQYQRDIRISFVDPTLHKVGGYMVASLISWHVHLFNNNNDTRFI